MTNSITFNATGKVIILETETAAWRPAQGIQTIQGLRTRTKQITHQGKKFKSTKYVYPQQDKARYYPEGSLHTGIVVPLGTRRFRVIYATKSDEDYPTGGTVTFIETDAPETPFVRKKTNTEIIFFGQPEFIQNAVFPIHEGKSGFVLFRLENGWGDSGNVHAFCALDDQGYPCRVWHEASCC